MVRFVPWAHYACPNVVLNLPGTVPRCRTEEHLRKITPALLFDAWQLRRNCFHQLGRFKMGRIRDAQIRSGVPDLELFLRRNVSVDNSVNDRDDQDTVDAVKLYYRRCQWLALQKGGKAPPKEGCHVTQDALHTVRVRLESNGYEEYNALFGSGHGVEQKMIDDVISHPELEFIDALQDWLLDAYDMKGIAIEVNLTSNVYIARLAKHAQHPIFRWYPPCENWLKADEKYNRFGLRRGPIRVCINTDDAGIMPTTLRTEFALLREAALELGVTRTDAEQWLKRLKAFGHEEFQGKHRPVWVRNSPSLQW